MDRPLWTLRGVALAGSPHPRLDIAELAIPPGVTAVVGPSGAGKTSLLNLLVGFEKPDAGEVAASAAIARNGKGTSAPSARALPLFWVPPGHGLWPHLTVRGHLEAVIPTPPPAGGGVEDLLAAFELDHLADARPARLSQGERARLAVARALAADPAVLVMDEPLVHVGPVQAGPYWAAVRERIRESGASLVFSSHDPGRVRTEAGYVIGLEEGRVCFAGSVGEWA